MSLDIDAIKQLGTATPFTAKTGMQVLDAAKGYAKALMPLEGNSNHINTMHAGALFTLAELPGGVISFTSFDMDKFYPIVKDMQIAFKRPATTDITAEARLSDTEIERIRADAQAKGKADFVLFCELKDSAGTVVAIGTGNFQLRSK